MYSNIITLSFKNTRHYIVCSFKIKIQMQIAPYIWVSGATILLVAFVSAVSKATDPHPTKLNGKGLSAVKHYMDSAVTLSKKADQDADLSHRLIDICFGMAYVNSARILATDVVIEGKCGIKVDELYATLRAQQQQCLAEMEK